MPYIGNKWYSDSEIAEIKRSSSSDDFSKFLVSGIIGAVTGSTIIGGLLGGSFLGGLMGDMFEGDEDSWF